MLLRRPISALLRPLLAAPAAPLRLSAAAAALRRRPGVVLPRPAPFCTSASNTAPASNAPACLDPLEALPSRLEKEKEIGTHRLVPGVEHTGVSPECGGGVSKEISFALRVSEDGAKCGWKGGLQAIGESKSPMTSNIDTELKLPQIITEESLQLQPLGPKQIEYFSSRSISLETLQRNGVMQKKRRREIDIAFIYKRNKKLVGCKFRGADKSFYQVAGSERIFYGLDDIEQKKEIIIVEGEMDKLSMEEAGYRNCVSVPDGAPAKVSKVIPSEEKDTKYKFLHNCKEYLTQVSRIIIATDSDPPGEALAEELARRLGKERCWRVKWPSGCKDANEVLMIEGRDTLKELIVNAEMYPIRGLLEFSAFFKEIDDYYNRIHGYELGLSTGWRALDEFYKVVPGELTLVTGVPNSGKSEWIDALLCNINASVGWKYVLCSMENEVRVHARKLLEKHFKKSFLLTSYGERVEHISKEELEKGKKWLNDSFYLIRCGDDCLPSISWVIDLAKAAVLRYGVRGLVIDPYNELDHQRPKSQTETEYVSQMLTKIKRFAQHHGCHVWFVAHPKQLQQWTGEPPNLYDISGSAHFINKCDNGIVIHRNRDPDAGPNDQVQICVRKVRNKMAGQIGDAFLTYNRVTGEYLDIEGGLAVCKPKQSKRRVTGEKKAIEGGLAVCMPK